MTELHGGLVRLRPPTDDDLDALVAIFAEDAVATWWGPYGRDRIADEIVHSDDPTTTILVVEVDGEVAGIVQSYEEPDPMYRAAGIDISLGTRWHDRGIGTDAVRTLARHLVARGHHHLTIDPAASNARAIACYAKVGFRPVGILRQNEQGPDGTFHDTLLMDLLAEELR